MFWVIFNACTIIFESYLLYILVKSMQKGVTKNKRIIILSFAIYLALYCVVTFFTPEDTGISMLFYLICDFIFVSLLCRGNGSIIKNIFITLFYYMLLMAIDLLAMSLFVLTEENLALFRIVATIITRLFIYIFLLIFSKIKTIQNTTIPILSFILMALCTAILLSLIGYDILDIRFSERFQIATLTIILSVLFILYFFMQQIQKEENLSYQIKMQNQLYEQNKKRYEAALDAYLSLKHVRHDTRHYLNGIRILLEQGEVEKAVELIGGVEKKIKQNIVYTGNDIIDAILHATMLNCEDKGIRLNVVGKLEKELPFDAVDLYTILSNVLENASEACLYLPQEKRVIKITFVYDNWLCIEVKNPISEAPKRIEGNIFKSTKQGNGHGIGLQSVQSACERHHGFLMINVEDNQFILQASLQPIQLSNKALTHMK